jgi:hypothetical protein
MQDPEASGAEIVAFVDIFETLEAFNEILVGDLVVFGIQQMHYADRQEYVGNGEMCDAKVVELSVDPNYF